MRKLLCSKKAALMCIVLGLIVGMFVGANLYSVNASNYDYQIHGELQTLNKQLGTLNKTFKSIDSKLGASTPEHLYYGQAQPGGLASIGVGLRELAKAVSK